MKHHCDKCGVEVDPSGFDCVVFTSHLGTKFTYDDITGVRCYPCEDEFIDKLMREDQS